jgi:hypothetical protein
MSAIQGDSTQVAAKALGLALGILIVVLWAAISRFNRAVRWQLRMSAASAGAPGRSAQPVQERAGTWAPSADLPRRIEAAHTSDQPEAGLRRVRLLEGMDEPDQSKER